MRTYKGKQWCEHVELCKKSFGCVCVSFLLCKKSFPFFFFFVYFFMIGAKNKIIHTYFSVCVCLVFMNEVIHFFFFFPFWCLFCYEQSHSIFLLIGALLLLKSCIHILVCSIFAMNEVIHFFSLLIDMKSFMHILVLNCCNSESAAMCTELASLLVDIIFRTLSIYDDRGSRKAVDDLIAKALGEVLFMKNFAAALVQVMERQLKVQSHVGCYRLLRWSCLLLSRSQFATVSKNALCRVAAAQASLLNIVVQRSFRERRACKQTFFNLFSQVLLV